MKQPPHRHRKCLEGRFFFVSLEGLQGKLQINTTHKVDHPGAIDHPPTDLLVPFPSVSSVYFTNPCC